MLNCIKNLQGQAMRHLSIDYLIMREKSFIDFLDQVFPLAHGLFKVVQ